MNNFFNNGQKRWLIIRLATILIALFSLFSTAFAQTYSSDTFSPKINIQDPTLFVDSAIRVSRHIHKTQHEAAKEYHYANLAIDKAKQAGEPLLLAEALDNLGLLYRFHQAYRQALELHQEANNLGDLYSANPHEKMRFANNLGVAARYSGAYNLAASYYLKALSLAEEAKDLRNIAIASNGLGNTLLNIEEEKEAALKFFKKALAVEEERHNKLGIAMNLLSMAELQAKDKDFDAAQTTLNRLYKINKEADNRYGIALTKKAYGDLFLLEGAYPESLKNYQEAFVLFKTLKDTLQLAEIHLKTGQFYLKTGAFEDSHRELEQALTLANRLNQPELQEATVFALATLNEKTGKFQEAMRYFKLGTALKDSLKLVQQATEIEALRSRFDFSKKEADLFAKSKKISTYHEYFLILGLIIIAALIILIIQRRNQKIKRWAIQEINEKEKQIMTADYDRHMAEAEMAISRTQLNPHFIFNSLNGIKLLIQKNEPKKAEQYLTAFSRFTRMVLESSKEKIISLEEEIELIAQYLALEKKRFGVEFQYIIDQPQINSGMTKIKIPPLLLQPFVENAIWHGLLPSEKEKKILKISLKQSLQKTEIRIEDNGVGRRKKQLQRNPTIKNKKSLGMQITQERIQQYNQHFDCHIDLEIEDKKDPTGTVVIISINHLKKKTHEL